MLKKRIIPIELYDAGRLHKTVQFSARRDVGHPVKASQVYSDQDADELLFLNISRDHGLDDGFYSVVSDISRCCFVPLTVGGGVKDVGHAEALFVCGADKVLINSIVYERPELVTDIAEKFGRQAVVVGIDVKRDADGYKLFSNCGRSKELINLKQHIDRVVEAGAGELMIQSIDNDGTMEGYDLDLIAQFAKDLPIPLIIAGGAGSFVDLKAAFDAGVDAVACGSLFCFGDNNPLRAKAFLKNYHIPLKKT